MTKDETEYVQRLLTAWRERAALLRHLLGQPGISAERKADWTAAAQEIERCTSELAGLALK